MNRSSDNVSRGFFPSGSLTFAALISLYAIVIVPLTVFRLYREEFAASFLEVAGYLIGGAVGGFVAIAGLLRVVPASVRGWVARALLCAVLLSWYNFNFLDYQRKIVGLDADVFEGRYAPYEYALFLAIAIGIAGTGRLNKHLVMIMALVCAVGTAGLALQNGGLRVRNGEHRIVPKELYAYSQESNVLHVVLDGMQSVFFQAFIDAHPEEGDRLMDSGISRTRSRPAMSRACRFHPSTPHNRSWVRDASASTWRSPVCHVTSLLRRSRRAFWAFCATTDLTSIF